MRRLPILAMATLMFAASCGTGSEPPTGGTPPPPTTSVPSRTTGPPIAPPAVETTTTTTTAPPTTTAAPAPTTSTTAPPPTTTVPHPPDAGGLSIADPAPGSTVTTRLYEFRGAVEPGSTVTAARRYPVDVAADGTWAVVLVLHPGGNLAVFTATDPAGTVSEVTLDVNYDPGVTLAADGLGAVAFGEPLDGALSSLTDRLGPPTSDDTYAGEPGDEVGWYGYPAFEYLRVVSWDEPGLMVMFSDFDCFRSDRVPHLNGWVYSGSGPLGSSLATAAGITTGATLAELQAAFGADLTAWPHQDELTGMWHWMAESDVPGCWSPDDRLRLRGRFDQDPATPGAGVVQLDAGLGFDEC